MKEKVDRLDGYTYSCNASGYNERGNAVKISTAMMVLLLCASVFARELPTTLVIPGTGACQELLQVVAAEFNKLNSGSKVIIPPSTGSSGGIRAVITDQAAMARVARRLHDNEAQFDLEYTVFGKDAVVFAVGESVSVRDLTSDQLADIFSGKIGNWQEVGGRNAKIRLLVREPTDASLIVIRQHIKSFQSISFPQNSKTLYHDSEMLAMLEKYKTSIGFLTSSTLSAAEKSVHSLSIDTIAPTPDNVLRGKYDLTIDFALVYKEDALDDLARRFMHYLLDGRGVDLLQKQGIIPTGGK